MKNTNNNNHKSIKTLQLDKILQQLAQFTCCEDAAAMALEITPDSDVEKVEIELQKADDALTLMMRYGRPSFIRFHDPRRDLKRANSGASLNNRELLNIVTVLEQVKSLKNWEKQCENVKTLLSSYFDNLVSCNNVYTAIRAAVVSEDEIDDHASEELALIRRKIRGAEGKSRALLEKIIRSSTMQKYLMEPIITIRSGRFVVPVKSEFRTNIPGLVHDSSSSGATLFIEPMSVVDANNEIKVLQKEEEDEIQRILMELTAMCAENSEVIENNYNLILIINLYFAKAMLATKQNAIKPEISKKRKITLKKARHPLISPEDIVPIDISVGGEYWGLIVTGPNTGGKTVSLKTLGLLTLMAQCGLLIPAAEDSEITIFDNVLADIGDEQSIEQNLSTFSSHITNIISIMQTAGDNSLVLLDELGSGTDPVEGAALAIAIIEELKLKGCLLSATTHYAELKQYALNTKGIENASCEFDVESLKPTYKLLIGVPGRSNAFAISQRLGMEKHVLERAKEFISNESRQFEDVVENLEQSRQHYEKELSEVKQKNIEIEKMKKEISALKTTIENDREKALLGVGENARRIIETVRSKANAIIDELDDIRKQKGKEDFASLAAKAKAQLQGKVDKLYDEIAIEDKFYEEEYVLPRPLKIGDEVKIEGINQKGILLTLPDKSGYCQIQAGIMKIKAEQKKLQIVGEATPAAAMRHPLHGRGQNPAANKEQSFHGKKQAPVANKEQSFSGQEQDSAVNRGQSFRTRGQNSVTNKTSDKVKNTSGSSSINTSQIISNANRKVSKELDLRGMNAEEALLELDQYIDDCVLSKITQICIIHGKGTGILRSAVNQHLKRHVSIKTHRLGKFGEGEDGVTIAEIKIK